MNFFTAPKISVICGPMKSGKSKELLMQIDKLEHSKVSYVLFKPNIDSRGNEGIKTRYFNHTKDAISIDVKNPQEMLMHIDVENIKFPFYVVIDEVQFFDNSIVELMLDLYSIGVSFIVSGLDLDAFSKTFGPVGDLLALATNVKKLTAVCEHCFAPATHSALKKYDPEFEKNNIKIGDEDIYEVFCSKCYFAKDRKDNN